MPALAWRQVTVLSGHTTQQVTRALSAGSCRACLHTHSTGWAVYGTFWTLDFAQVTGTKGTCYAHATHVVEPPCHPAW